MSVSTLPQAVIDAAARFGDALAIVDRERLTFAQLEQRVLHGAAALIEAGLTPGDRAAIWAPNSAEWIVACLSVQSAGGVVVTMNTRMKGLEAQYILNKTRARILLTVGDFLGQDYRTLLDGLDLPHLERVLTLDGDWNAFAATGRCLDRARAAMLAVGGDDPADILFTSGTTGHPKGVVSGHAQSVQAFTCWAHCAGLTEGDRYLIVNPFFHTFGYKAGWLACLLKGATAYPMATFDPARVVDLVEGEGITVLPGPPTIFQQLLTSSAKTGVTLSSIRVAVTGAASVAPSLVKRMQDELGIRNVLTAYGLTESSGMVTMSQMGDGVERIATSCGRPIPGVEVKCVNRLGESVAPGREGEIWVRGFNVMAGYFEDPEATAEAVDAQGWLHTGDIGCFDADGYLRVTDRMKDMYISGGFNCYPAEIERILSAHPAIAQVAVIGTPDERLGEIGKAFIVLRAGAEATAEEICQWCRANMANYKAPRAFELVEALPVNAAGKVQKFLLAAMAGNEGARHG
ncbi:MAG: FadD3 family acyl-CoA ligase [Brevundimonas sp.]|uniref:FadD3 family acyl-CoA ligase n=1 Tax=Brevundimonas sp. TaxID=1871086 RepID=UPI00248742C2|nr:FadD3 family acyl-CoA ligase [Brevundimonas sp.]MDI1328516.1 FadD3 family acyl-CoA ligase [Brevundimonas sp.]